MRKSSRSFSLQKPLKDRVIEWGVHVGETWGQVERSYIEFLISCRQADIEALEDELNRRDLLDEAELPMVEKILRAGRNALAQKYHPDHGGSDKEMRELNAAYEALNEILAMHQVTP